MTTIDEIEELRAELRHTHLTAAERGDAEARLSQLLQNRSLPSLDPTGSLPSDRLGRNGLTNT